MLAPELVSNMSIPYPQMPHVFSGYCLIQTEFHQISLWISGLRTDLSLDRPFWVSWKRLPRESEAFSLSHKNSTAVYQHT